MKKTLKVFLAMVMLISSMASMSVSAAWDGSAVNHPAYNETLGVFGGPGGAAISGLNPIAWGKEPGVATSDAITTSSGVPGMILLSENTWWSQYQVEVPYTGLYIAKVRASASSNAKYMNSSIEMVSETGSKAYFTVKGYGWPTPKWSHEQDGDQYIYLPAGVSTITLTCPAAVDNGCAFLACEFYAMDNKGAKYISESDYIEADNSERANVILDPIGDFVGEDVTTNADGSITLAAGESVTLATESDTPAGLYYVQVKANDNNTNRFRIETSQGHYGVIDQYAKGLNYFFGDPDNEDVEVVYLSAGATNTITLTNNGKTDANIGAIILAADSDNEYTAQMNIKNCKMIKEITSYPEGWNGSATSHPNYSEYLDYVVVEDTLAAGEETTYTLTDVPADGVYLVGATLASKDVATLRVQNNKLVGSVKYYAEFDIESTAGELMTTDELCGDQYIYLTAGTNELVVKNTGTADIEVDCLDFYVLDGTVDYIAQCKTMNLSFTYNYTSQMSDTNSANNSTGAGWFLQWNGSYIQFSPDVGEAGIYEVELQYASPYAAAKNLEEQPFFYVDSSSGYCLFLPTVSGKANDHWDWKAVSTDVFGNKAYMYLDEGVNKIKITSRHVLGSNNASLDFVSISIKPVAEDAGVTIDNCMEKTPDPIVVQAESVNNLLNYHDYYTYRNEGLLNKWATNVELTTGEWLRYTVNAKAAGNYKVSASAIAYGTAATIVVETENGITEAEVPLTGGLANGSGGSVYLKEGSNTVYVRNGGVGHFLLDSFTFAVPAIYPEVTTDEPARVFVPAQNYIGAAETTVNELYTVRNYLNGITFSDGDVREYDVKIVEEGRYSLVMTATVPLSPTMKVTLTNGEKTVTFVNGEIEAFGNQNTAATNMISSNKFTLEAGDYKMRVEYTSNPDEGGVVEYKTHIHGFELTNFTDEDRVVEAFRKAATTADVEAIIAKYARVLGSAGLATDFPVAYEYAMAYLLTNGKSVTTYADVLDLYDFAKRLITKEAISEDETLYTIRVSEWVSEDAQVVLAVYEKAVITDEETGEVTAAPDKMTGVSIGEFFEVEDGYYYVECIVPNDVFTIDDNGNDSYAEKLMIWESFETLTPEDPSNF